MTMTLVQANLGNSGSTSANSLNVLSRFTNPTTAGNFLVIGTFCSITGATPTVSDTMAAPGTSGWQQFGSMINSQPVAVWKGFGSFWVLPNAPSISNLTDFTWHLGFSGSFGAKIGEMVMMEFSGVSTDAGNFFDAQHSATGTASAPNPGNITATKSDLVLTGFVGQSGAGLTTPAGFTSGISLAAAQFGQYAYQLNATPGTISSPWTGGTETPWGAGQAGFLPPAIKGFSEATLTFF